MKKQTDGEVEESMDRPMQKRTDGLTNRWRNGQVDEGFSDASFIYIVSLSARSGGGDGKKEQRRAIIRFPLTFLTHHYLHDGKGRLIFSRNEKNYSFCRPVLCALTAVALLTISERRFVSSYLHKTVRVVCSLLIPL